MTLIATTSTSNDNLASAVFGLSHRAYRETAFRFMYLINKYNMAVKKNCVGYLMNIYALHYNFI